MPTPPGSNPLRPDRALLERLDRLGLEFTVDFHQIARRQNPDNLEVLAELGHAYTRLGRHREGLEVDRRLVALAPDNPTAHYNLACSLALLGRPDEALSALEASIERGYGDLPHLLRDEDLRSLRDHERFRSIVETLSSSERGG